VFNVVDKGLTTRISIWYMDAFEGGKGERGVFLGSSHA
jgi:hypothetical protein